MSIERSKLLIDYEKSILLIEEEYVRELEVIASKKQDATIEKQRRMLEKESSKQ